MADFGVSLVNANMDTLRGFIEVSFRRIEDIGCIFKLLRPVPLRLVRLTSSFGIESISEAGSPFPKFKMDKTIPHFGLILGHEGNSTPFFEHFFTVIHSHDISIVSPYISPLYHEYMPSISASYG